MKSKECKIEGCVYPVWSGGLCKSHIKHTPMKKKTTSTIEIMKPFQDKYNRHQERTNMFMKLWKEKPHKSEVSGDSLGSSARSTFFHHILPKSKYPMAEFDPENIILMTPDEHNNVENDMYKYEEVNTRRQTLLRKYDLI